MWRMSPTLTSSSALLRAPALLAACRHQSYKSKNAPQKAPPPAAAAMAAVAAAPVASGGATSCQDEGPAPERKLSALQRRQVMMKSIGKKEFTLTPNAMYRIKLLLGTNNDADAQAKRTAAALKAAAPNAADDLDEEELEQAVAKVRELKAQAAAWGAAGDPRHIATGVRIGVKRRGCSGYSYTVTYSYQQDPAHRPSDVHVEQGGVNVFVESGALFYVVGTVMDFTTSDVEEKFSFKNPNEQHSCGCGESFMPFDV
jgi:iron-sulfur cluster assembly protein